MKKHGIYNKALMTAIADMGHEEYIVIGDAGVPIAKPEQRIDLAISKDLPTISQVLDLIMDDLTEEEVRIYKRGRNAKAVTRAKNASMSDYRTATGFEALMGWLYLTGQSERMMQLIKKCIVYFILDK